MDCPSHRVIQKILKAYGIDKENASDENKLYLSTALHLNQEAILLQVIIKLIVLFC
jgi:hypothetical protein